MSIDYWEYRLSVNTPGPDFLLCDIQFSREHAAAVEQKQIAEQRAQQAKYFLERRKQETELIRQVAQGQPDPAVISAKATAKVLLIQVQAEAQTN
jgi:hypothetical protein